MSKESDEDESTKPVFIYGGPFIEAAKDEPFLNSVTPMNVQLQGTFKQSYAYESLKERLPVILTKAIDSLSKAGKSDVVNCLAQLKSELVTNKKYTPLEGEGIEIEKWNKYIQGLEFPYYFQNIWVGTECYVHRRIQNALDMYNCGDLDIWADQKRDAFKTAIPNMCTVATRVLEMVTNVDEERKKVDLALLIKLSMWANSCDLSLSLGDEITLPDPFQMIIDKKDKVVTDDSNKAADAILKKSEVIKGKIEAAKEPKEPTEAPPEPKAKPPEPPVKPPEPPAQPSEPLAEGEEPPAEPEEPPPPPPKPPCPSKINYPPGVNFDMILDNVGYELFMDLCLADYVISFGIARKARFYLKKFPWFVSDATIKNFHQFLSSCSEVSYSMEVPPDPKARPPPEGEEPSPPRVITAEPLKELAARWKRYLDENIFILSDEDYWVGPYLYKEMKVRDPFLYRKLQFACVAVFKGDLNYRKLLGERNCNPYTGFEPNLQGFIPAPILALRTVKSDIICGVPKGKMDVFKKLDEHWMRKGEYGVIHFCDNADPLIPEVASCQE